MCLRIAGLIPASFSGQMKSARRLRMTAFQGISRHSRDRYLSQILVCQTTGFGQEATFAVFAGISELHQYRINGAWLGS
jgi:hypothetical protein